MKKNIKNITTLNELADYLNDICSMTEPDINWDDVRDICKQNGWGYTQDLDGYDDEDVATNGLEFVSCLDGSHYEVASEEPYPERTLHFFGFDVEQSISGYWRLMRNGDVYDDSACEELNGEQQEAEYFFADYFRNEMWPAENQLCQALKEYDEGMNYTIVSVRDIQDDARLMAFRSQDGMAESSAVVYDDGTIFVTDDWQAAYPTLAEEIANYDWQTLDGRRAVIVDGLPRIL